MSTRKRSEFCKMMIATRSIAKRNVLDCLLGLIKSGIEEEMVCVSIAYITIGSTQRAKAVFDTGLIEPLRTLVTTKKMGIAAAAISIAIICTSGIAYTKDLMDCCIDPLCDYLGFSGGTISLKAVESILKFGKCIEEEDGYTKRIEEAGGLEKLEYLSTTEIRYEVVPILGTYWPSIGRYAERLRIMKYWSSDDEKWEDPMY
ncbi:importin subunit alpha-1a-like isoform X2 [Nicotiana tomentosiformis]|uniref:importin subunit alpha-1a-like isoform X2 n=1 Tax=Nicotiana tomentosiformis TaxID=4098 RepID=UPI00388CCF10